jgi:hypothetical protein
MLATGRPQSVLAGYGLISMPAFPPGFYEGREAEAMGAVVLRELPPTPETLLLRLMGRGPVLASALRELAQLPHDAWERTVAVPPLVAARFGAMPAGLRAAVDASADPATLERWSVLIATSSAEEVAATILSGQRSS